MVTLVAAVTALGACSGPRRTTTTTRAVELVVWEGGMHSPTLPRGAAVLDECPWNGWWCWRCSKAKREREVCGSGSVGMGKGSRAVAGGSARGTVFDAPGSLAESTAARKREAAVPLDSLANDRAACVSKNETFDRSQSAK
jgi:hypothetical protein